MNTEHIYILGLNAYHPDSSACLFKDNELIAAVEEERFRRIKHWAGFPGEAIKYCLKEGEIVIEDIDYIVLNRDPRANFLKKIIFVLTKKPDLGLIFNRLKNVFRVKRIKQTLAQELGVEEKRVRAKVINIEHHLAHMASAFFASPFDEAAIVSVDAFGDFTSLKVGHGKGNKIKELFSVNYPHSLGMFYTAVTQFLGFRKFGDEYKVMGLAAFGKPKYLKEMEKIVLFKPHGRFELNQDYFSFYKKGENMSWDNAQPHVETLYSKRFIEVFGKPREKNEDLSQRHMDLAASLQAMYEKAFFRILREAHKLTSSANLCLAGGCALNSAANGKLLKNTPFQEVYIQPAAGDAGGALGAVLYFYHHILNNPRGFKMRHAFWGPHFSDAEISQALKQQRLDDSKIEKLQNRQDLLKKTAELIAQGNVVGWFQGRLEWGPRALGNRSILADPRRPEMREILNQRIKKREWFRPFAPSILEGYIGDYFEENYPVPFMIKVYTVKENKKKEIPAVTHKDGTGRPQTVAQGQNRLYWDLIDEFRKATGVPLVLNTSFNENEPIVCTPQQAINCFLRTKMDVLVIGSYMVRR